MSVKRLCQLLAFSLMYGLLSGCGGPEGPVRVPLEGIVSAAEIPGDLNGTISLLPKAGTNGPAANGLIRNGLFEFTNENGPVPGEHRVLIDVEPPRGKLDNAAEQAALQWKFEYSVTVPSEPPFQSDFALVRESPDESVEDVPTGKE